MCLLSTEYTGKGLKRALPRVYSYASDIAALLPGLEISLEIPAKANQELLVSVVHKVSYFFVVVYFPGMIYLKFVKSFDHL